MANTVLKPKEGFQPTRRDPKSSTLTCIVPVYNESEGISEFIQALVQTLSPLVGEFEILVIDDGSCDNTFEVLATLEQPGLRGFQLSRHFGKEIAITAGIEHARGELVLLIDSDFQHPLEYIPIFLEKWQQGFDMVYGILANRENESLLKRIFATCFYQIMDWITKVQIPKNAGDFRLLDKKVIDSLKSFEERSRFMKGLYAWVGFKNIGIPFKANERKKGKSAFHFKRLAGLALTGLVNFSDVPLRLFGIIGFFISLLAFGYMAWIIFVTLFYGVDVPGYATIVVAIMFFGGVQLLSVGILGEYIARIFNEVKRRPKYIIANTI